KSNLKNQTAEANLIFMDGTRETAKVDMDKSKGAPVKLSDDSAYDTTKGLLDGKDEEDGDFALLNTWCTYTVNANGVYTLTEVAKAIDDGTGTTAKTKIKTAQYHDNVDGAKINTKNTSLAGALSGSYAKVYGNDNSVYLTAKLDYVRFDGTNYAAVISSADNVVTNIDKADITTENSATVAAKDKFSGLHGMSPATAAGGVYTLYNDKGYVIAAMVVGKDAGATSNLVYVHTDDVERERYNPKTSRATTDGDWTWVRKVIFEGEEVELTETGDNLQYINASSMVKGSWYKVTFNANNEVISSASVFGGKADMVVGPGVNSADPAAKAEAIYRAVDINPSINEYDTVVFQRVYVGTSNDVAQYVVRPSLTGNTLYVETKNDTGVRVAEDVKTVLVQTKANKEETTYYTTSTQLKNIIDDLNDNGEGYKFQMNLVILKGAVRYVVIRDDIKDGYKPTEPTGSVKVSFFDTQYPVTGDNRYDFYVNGKLVTSFDETVPGEKSFKVAANDAIRVLARGNKNFGSANGEVKVDTASKITGNVIANGTILEFKATTSLTLADGIAATGSSGSSAIDSNIKATVKFVDADGKTLATPAVTDAHIVVTGDPTGSGEKYNGYNIGDLYLAFTMPSDQKYTANSPEVNATVNGKSYPGIATTSVADSGIVKVAKTDVPADTAAGAATTIELVVTSDEVVKNVDVKLPSGYNAIYTGSATTETFSTKNAAALKVKFDGAGKDNFLKVDVEYKITGLAGGEKTGTLTAQAVANDGTVTITSLTGVATEKADPAADKVVIEITKVTGNTVKGKVDVSAVTDVVPSNSETTINAIAGHGKGVELDLTTAVSGFTMATNVKSAVVEYELVGVTAKAGNDAGLTGTAKLDAANGLVIQKTDKSGDATAATFVVKGDEVVTVKITKVTEVTLDKTKTLFTPVGTVDGATVQTVAAANDIVLENQSGKWVNKSAVTLNVALNKVCTDAATVVVLKFNGGECVDKEFTGDAVSKTVSIAAGELNVSSFVAPIILIASAKA
ncbi:MAG: hypothetical protein HFF48_04595, partial [Lawsonibacter sp.]|nr:hypothetical protein [Lawsonibacter sp.]